VVAKDATLREGVCQREGIAYARNVKKEREVTKMSELASVWSQKLEIRRLKKKLDEYEQATRVAYLEPCGDERHCACVPLLRVEIDRLRHENEYLQGDEYGAALKVTAEALDTERKRLDWIFEWCIIDPGEEHYTPENREQIDELMATSGPDQGTVRKSIEDYEAGRWKTAEQLVDELRSKTETEKLCSTCGGSGYTQSDGGGAVLCRDCGGITDQRLRREAGGE
jgi:hypothetical protein